MEESIQTPSLAYLSGGGLPPVELAVVGGVRRLEPRLQEDAAQGDGLDGRRALELILGQQPVVPDGAGQARGETWRLVDGGVGLHLFTDHRHILRLTLAHKHTHT
ncbi:hypothetical protein EYF80_057338 [Liparis tanakae]|uniref:Uncharacterized protein n=1 Tax=Liparis tanakae TaxID=230148 RepID=A0A4Z2EUN1_9TELE|nr:hypothetical protein EYF80_057338 [Liparis tanakae]